MKIKTGDTVLIIAGDDKSRTGKVVSVFPKENKLLVGGINIQKRHTRPKKEGEKGQIVEKPGPIAVSNVKFVCPKCNKPTKLAVKKEGKKKLRVCKNCGQTV